MGSLLFRYMGSAASTSRFVLAVFVSFSAFLTSPVASAEDNGAWVVKAVSGGVTRSYRGGDWAALAPGQRLLPGTRLKSGPTGQASITRYGDVISLSPSGAVELPASKNGAGVSGVIQTLGTLLFKIVTRKENRFSVRTPTLAAVIKGTAFAVNVGPGGSSLHVTEGAVQVTSLFTGESALIRPGQTGVVSATGRRGLKVLNGNRSRLRKSPAGRRAQRASGADKSGAAKSAGRLITRTLGNKPINMRGVTKGLADGEAGASDGLRGSAANKDVGLGMASGQLVIGGSSTSSASPNGLAVGLTGATRPGLVNNGNGNAKGKGKN